MISSDEWTKYWIQESYTQELHLCNSILLAGNTKPSRISFGSSSWLNTMEISSYLSLVVSFEFKNKVRKTLKKASVTVNPATDPFQYRSTFFFFFLGNLNFGIFFFIWETFSSLNGYSLLLLCCMLVWES